MPHIVGLAQFLPALSAFAERDPGIGDIRGRGAMIAIELTTPVPSGLIVPEPDPGRAGRVARACHAAGLLVLTCGTYGNVLRFLPPLVISEAEVDRGLEILETALLDTI